LEHAPPEISSPDLSPTMLFLADWGCTTVQGVLEELPFVDSPGRAALEKSIQLLADLQALERHNGEGDQFSITSLVQEIAKIPTHPRFATNII
jgi:HrpA-like RNA helicase